MATNQPMSVAIIVNSCEPFYKTTPPLLRKSALVAGIPPEHLYVVVGECDEEKAIETTPEYHIAFCKYVNETYNAAIYFSQTEPGRTTLSRYTHFFYLQDTCEFLPGFYERIKAYTEVCDDYIKLQPAFSKSIGMFSTNWFLENKSELLRYYVNCDKSKRYIYKSGDFPNKDEILARFSGLPKYLNEDAMFLFNESREPLGKFFQNVQIHQTLEKKYGHDSVRLVNRYDNPGIIKYQKNWHGNQHNGFVLEL